MQKVLFYDEDYVYQASELSYVVDKQSDICRDNFCCRDYVCQVLKLQHMYLIGLILYKFKSKVLKQINRNLGGLSRGSFLPLAPSRLRV